MQLRDTVRNGVRISNLRVRKLLQLPHCAFTVLPATNFPYNYCIIVEMQTQVDGVVFGAGGGVGLQCVKHMLQNGQKVRAVVRSPDTYADTFPKDQNLSIVAGGEIQFGLKLSSFCCAKACACYRSYRQQTESVACRCD